MSDTIIGSGSLDGRGVYAARNFRKGEVVIIYHLRSLTQQQIDDLPEDEHMFAHTHSGVTYLYSEPERYVNHSENPNTYQDISRGCDIALRDIAEGEMITTDATKDDAP